MIRVCVRCALDTNLMGQLTDKEIRVALIRHLRGRPVAPKAVLEEVRVHNGNAIADVVAVHRAAHCYEIKGETDAIARIARQGSYYDQAFRRITLVTTENHLRQALRIAPAHWGVMVATSANHQARAGVEGPPMLRYVRKATISPRFDKHVALLALWKCELLTMCGVETKNVQKLSRANLSEMIAERKGAREVSASIAQLLLTRHINNGWPVAM